MKNYVVTFSDNGGVHSNSNIHNKAAYNLLTARSQDGCVVLESGDVSRLFYETLLELTPRSKFADAGRKFLDLAKVLFSGSAELEVVIHTVRRAYRQVGIEI